MHIDIDRYKVELDLPEKEYDEIFRMLRERLFGITCKKCSSINHYWKKDKKAFECIQCGFRTTLKSGTILHKSRLPIKYWFLANYYTSRLGYSALKIQKILGHKRYEPIYRMTLKLLEAQKKYDTFYIAMEYNDTSD